MAQTATSDGAVMETANAQDRMIDDLAALLGAEDDTSPPEEERRDRAAVDEEQATEEVDAAPQEESDADEDMESERAEDEVDEGSEEEPDDERWMPQSLEEIAEALERPVEEVLSSLKVKTKVDGVDGEATLKDVLKSYQLESALNKRLEAYANERKQFEQYAKGAAEQLQQRLQDAQTWAETVEQMVLADYQSVDWSELKENDPTEYLLTQQKMQAQWAQAQQVKKQVEERRQKQQQEQMGQTQAQWNAYLQDQMRQLQAAIPDVQEVNKTLQYLRSMGASDQELSQISDHRVVVMAHKAMQYDQMKQKADPKVKQMKTKPKFVPPGSRKSPQAASVKRQNETFKRAKKLQTDEAWTEALEARLFS